MEDKQITTVILDLDNTLIRTEKIKNYIDSIATQHGIRDTEAADLYKSVRKADGEVAFDLNGSYLEILKFVLDQKKLQFNQDIFNNTVKQMESDPTLLIEGAKELLEILAQKGLRIVILSLGDSKWQKKKMDFSGLTDCIEQLKERYKATVDVVFTNRESESVNRSISYMIGEMKKITSVAACKITAIKEIFGKDCDGKAIVFFNDKPTETDDLLAEFSKLRAYIRIEETDRRYNSDNFKELEKKYPDRVVVNTSLLRLKELFVENLASNYETDREHARSQHR